MKLFDRSYRVVHDPAGGFVAQYRNWWSPIWWQCSNFDNSWVLRGTRFPSAHGAMLEIKQHKKAGGPKYVVWQE